MFLAIINDTYGEVKAEVQVDSEMTITEYFKKVRAPSPSERNLVTWTACLLQGYKKMLSKLTSRRDQVIDIAEALRDADQNKDKQIDFEEWRTEMKQ